MGNDKKRGVKSNMDDSIYWIWLQQALRSGNRKVRTVKMLYGNAEDFYYSSEMEKRLCGCFSEKELDALKSTKIDEAASIRDKCDRLGYDVITLSDDRYPVLLKTIPNPPCVLYTYGKLSELDSNICISIVGTRSATLYGIQMAFDISRELAGEGVIIVSGGALGIDSSAHKGAIQGGGRTVAVLGCGINYPYLMQNVDLRNLISMNGAVISEYPPDYPAYSSNFPIRNRIISGLSAGTVIIEAGEKSGSLITANLANDQNRDVFAVPVDMRTSVSKGTTGLIRDGAKVVTCAEDILLEYRRTYINKKPMCNNQESSVIFERPDEESYKMEARYHNSEKPARGTKKVGHKSNKGSNTYKVIKEPEKVSEYNPEKELSPDMLPVYRKLQDGKIHIDELSSSTGITTRQLLIILMELELLGIVISYPGRIYGLNTGKE